MNGRHSAALNEHSDTGPLSNPETPVRKSESARADSGRATSV